MAEAGQLRGFGRVRGADGRGRRVHLVGRGSRRAHLPGPRWCACLVGESARRFPGSTVGGARRARVGEPGRGEVSADSHPGRHGGRPDDVDGRQAARRQARMVGLLRAPSMRPWRPPGCRSRAISGSRFVAVSLGASRRTETGACGHRAGPVVHSHRRNPSSTRRAYVQSDGRPRCSACPGKQRSARGGHG